MNINNFEGRIKSAFERHRPNTDNDAIWGNIEPHLKKKKKRRAIIFFFWGLGLGLLLFCWLNGTTPVEPRPAASTESPSEKATQNSERETLAPVKPMILPQSGSAAADSRSGFSQKPAIAPARIEPAGGNAMTSGTVTPMRAHNIPPEKAGEPPVQETPHSAIPAFPEVPVPEKQELPVLNLPDKSEQVAADKNGVQPDKNGEEAAKKTKKDKNRKPRKKPKKGKLKWEQSLEIQAGPALAAKRLSARKGVVIPSGYLDGRKATEHGLESFTAGLFCSAATPDGLLLKAGLNYRQINEKFHLAYTEKKIQVKNGVLTQTVDGSGNIIGQTTGPKTVTTTTEYSYKAFNHYRLVNLPIGIGYRHSGKKSRWELSGGLDINLFFRIGGTIYNRYLEPTTLTFGGVYYDEVFRRNAGLGAWASWSYGRKLKERLWWQVSASIQTPFSPVSNPEYELVQRYFNFGLQAGVVFQVGKR